VRPGPTGDRRVYTAQIRLDRVLAKDPAALRAAKERLNADVDRYVTTHGYTILSVRPATDPPAGPGDPITLRLEVVLEPRTDGEWPAIRQALEEDEADRISAKAARAADPVHGRLDALRDAADVWGDRGLRGLSWPASGPYAR